jgi:hypothetical protein
VVLLGQNELREKLLHQDKLEPIKEEESKFLNSVEVQAKTSPKTEKFPKIIEEE